MIGLFQRMNLAIKNLDYISADSNRSVKEKVRFLKMKKTLIKEIQRINEIPDEGSITLINVEAMIGTSQLESNVIEFKSNVINFPKKKISQKKNSLKENKLNNS